jgi:hypothetical protein
MKSLKWCRFRLSESPCAVRACAEFVEKPHKLICLDKPSAHFYR